MNNQIAESRSNATGNSRPSPDHGPTSGAADSTDARADDSPDTPATDATATDARADSNTTPRGRKHPALATVRLRHGTKGRAKDAARARGMSLCAFIREAVRDALDTHEKSPDAV